MFFEVVQGEKKEGKMTLLGSLDDWEGIQVLLVQLIL
jgi:hypothetical protein